jgi:demethylmenaquinone methyltransferase / 2-methoxy-6-polyprenyl-1,4-benzoquinol methylase
VREELAAKRASEIRGLFGRIAWRYDLLNRVLSLGQDRRWRSAVAARVAQAPPGRLLDVCTGTGDLALGLASSGRVYGCDFSLPMLARARGKGPPSPRGPSWFAADALRLPLADGALDAVTVAFGIRNFEDLEAGLCELARVLRPGGRVVILEFSTPRGVFAPLLRWWVRHLPPLVGRVVSGDGEAYRYLADSVASFPDGAALRRRLEAAGFAGVRATPLTGGVATLYEGEWAGDSRLR